MTGSAGRLAAILESVPARLGAIPEAEAGHRPAPGHWSRKEILGHLIDSAANNHQRIVRARLTPRLDFPGYEQESWVASQSYASEPWRDLVELWVTLNRHLLHIIRAVPEAALAHQCVIGGKPPVTLAALIDGYRQHLEHHLDQLFTERT